MGQIIGFINQKGGCGKSTVSVHFVYWFTVIKKKNVLLVDSDAQKSSSKWLEGMDITIPHIVLNSPDDLLEQLPVLVTEYDYLIVDGPASLAEETRAILFRADLAVIPVQPTGVDLRSANDAIRLVKQAQSVRGGIPAVAIFISRAVKNTNLKKEAIALLSQIEDTTLIKTVIHQKQAIGDTSGQNATVWDLSGKPANDSAKEYEKLFDEIIKMLPKRIHNL